MGSATPCLCALPGSLPVPQYFTAFVSAIDSAVNPTPHPWKRFRILIPLPSPVHLNLNAFCKQDFMHDLLPPPPCSPLHSLSLSFPLLTSWLTISPKNPCGDGLSSCGLGECAAYNSSHGAGRQAGSSPLPPRFSFLSFPGLLQIPKHYTHLWAHSFGAVGSELSSVELKVGER